MRRTKSFSRLTTTAAMLALTLTAADTTPAHAASVTIFDASGVDYDAACLAPDLTAQPSVPDAVASPGNPGGSGVQGGGGGCEGVSVYDGSTESTDLRSVSLTSNGIDGPGTSDTQLVASFTVDGPIPAAGCDILDGSCGADLPLPELPGGRPSYPGVKYLVMFQNPARQNNRPTNNVGGGCARTPSGIALDQHQHWTDGYHHFISLDVIWTGTAWVHVASTGTYDPSPAGGLISNPFAYTYGDEWQGTHNYFDWDVSISGSVVTIVVDGITAVPNVLCSTGAFNVVYAKRGDGLVNVKGITAVTTVEPITPVFVWSNGVGVHTGLRGGFVSISDTTPGNSRNNGLVGWSLPGNTVGIAYTPGPPRRAVMGSWVDGHLAGGDVFVCALGCQRLRVCPGNGFPGTDLEGCWNVSPPPLSRSAEINADMYGGVPDTLGQSPSCPTPTYGGLLPTNPFLNSAVGCQYDDDNIPVHNPNDPLGPWTAMNPGERGTFLPEFWDTNYSIVA